MSHQPSSGKRTCMQMLQDMLDGEATPEQQDEFKDHMYGCMPCYQKYNLEMVIKDLLKSKCCGQGAPPELIAQIKAKIEQKNVL
ncbi:MAG: mycothiol system anti-sigma-R factor [Cyclobacteriaceae bacterium]|nr:mycothiol system anti-sigma-R factor [Cyclobacteriaceae bacterium]